MLNVFYRILFTVLGLCKAAKICEGILFIIISQFLVTRLLSDISYHWFSGLATDEHVTACNLH